MFLVARKAFVSINAIGFDFVTREQKKYMSFKE